PVCAPHLVALPPASAARPQPPSLPTRRSSDLHPDPDRHPRGDRVPAVRPGGAVAPPAPHRASVRRQVQGRTRPEGPADQRVEEGDRKSTRLNSSHVKISYAVFCLNKKNTQPRQ